ncbi:MAG: hypothetical protein ACOY31_04015 [Bacillota bacterium]
MIKLLKQESEKFEYCEIWENEVENVICINRGTVGTKGTVDIYEIPEGQNAGAIMRQMSQEVQKNGYCPMNGSMLKLVMIRYDIAGEDISGALERRHIIEDLMDECLGLTGNGLCDGGNISRDCMSIACMVVDLDSAVKTMVEELKNNGFLEGATIIHYYGEQNRKVLYP